MAGLPLGDKQQYQFTVAELCHELKIEHGFRERVYGRQVRDGKRVKGEAERKMAMMRAIEKLLREKLFRENVTVDYVPLKIPPPD